MCRSFLNWKPRTRPSSRNWSFSEWLSRRWSDWFSIWRQIHQHRWQTIRMGHTDTIRHCRNAPRTAIIWVLYRQILRREQRRQTISVLDSTYHYLEARMWRTITPCWSPATIQKCWHGMAITRGENRGTRYFIKTLGRPHHSIYSRPCLLCSNLWWLRQLW